MIFDHRTYGCHPGTVPLQLKLYENYGKTAQERHLGPPLLYAVTETGPLNSFVHVWAYEDAADRTARRAAMQADPEWQTYLKMSAEAGHLVFQETKILTAAPFFTLRR